MQAGPAIAAEAVQQLETILADSAASMHSTAGATTGNVSEGGSSASTSSKAEKAAWWRARLGLDQRLSTLLEGLDSRCLGPWLCAVSPFPFPRNGHMAVYL